MQSNRVSLYIQYCRHRETVVIPDNKGLIYARLDEVQTSQMFAINIQYGMVLYKETAGQGQHQDKQGHLDKHDDQTSAE